MDEIVAAALRKWPHVPACRGWLALDHRGTWWMRDEPTQRQGPFEVARGSRIEHAGLIAFIGRNYDTDGNGAWYFQNGPQRVYVDLEVAPWILRWPVDGPAVADLPGAADAQTAPGSPDAAAPAGLRLQTHTGRAVQVLDEAPWTDEFGRLFFFTELGLGLVHTQDMHLAADAIESGRCAPPRETRYAELVARSRLVRVPRER